MEIKEKNTVKVELYELLITDRKDDRFGRVSFTKSMTEEDLIDESLIHGTDLNRSTLKAAINLLKKTAIRNIANGAIVQFGLGHFSLKVNGVFIGNHAKWESDKHHLAVSVRPSAELRDVVKKCHVDVRGMASSPIAINTIFDVTTEQENTQLTIGGGINVTGSRIKISGEDPSVGLKLVSISDESEVEIPKSKILINDPSKLTFIVPTDMEEGEYKLVLTTQFSVGINLKEPRVYTYENILEVTS